MRIEIISYLPQLPRTDISILFVHGGYQGAWCYEENFLPYFKKHNFKSYALSFRGHGNSEGRDKINEFTLTDYAEDVLNVMEQIGGRFVLVGHSLGGGVVQSIIESHPDLVVAGVLMSSIPPYGMSPSILMKMAMKTGISDAINLKSLHKGKIDGDNKKFPYRCFFSEELDGDLKKKYALQIQEESFKAGMQMLNKVVKNTKDIKVPMKIIGAEFDWFFPKEVNEETAKMYGTNAVIIPKSGHCMMLDINWEMVSREIKDFIKEVINEGDLDGE